MIELKGVSFAYGRRMAVEDVSLTIEKGELVALMGPNASGKSTLLKLMNGLLLPDKGRCLVDGVDTAEDPDNARLKVGMAFQDPEDAIIARKVVDDVSFGPRNLGLSPQEAKERALETLHALGLDTEARMAFDELSGGRRQLVAFAGALAMRPSYLALDEPSSLLDGEGSAIVRDAIYSLKAKGIGIIWATHDASDAMLADRVVILDGGKLVTQGAPREALWETIQSCVDVPEAAVFLNKLKELGMAVDTSPCRVEEAVSRACR